MSAAKTNKKVRAAKGAIETAEKLASQKVCRRAPTGEANLERLAWRSSWMDHEGPWDWASLAGEKFLEILKKLAGWEAMTWTQLLATDPHNQHFIPLAGLVPAAQKRLEELRLDDLDQLFRFRLMQAERLWGVRVGNVFYLLWWDPDHEVCPGAAYSKPSGN